MASSSDEKSVNEVEESLELDNQNQPQDDDGDQTTVWQKFVEALKDAKDWITSTGSSAIEKIRALITNPKFVTVFFIGVLIVIAFYVHIVELIKAAYRAYGR